MDIGTTEQSAVATDDQNALMMRNMAVAIYGAMIVVILILNMIIVIGVVRGRLIQKTKINIYLMSLVISRMLIATFVLPAQITARFSEAYIITSVCKLCHFTAMGSSAVSVMSTAAIAIVKYREFIVHNGQINMSSRVVARDLVIIWVIGHVYSIRAAIFNDLFYDEGLETWRCGITPEYTTINSYFLFVDLGCLFMIPLCIVSVCYKKLIKHLNDTDSCAMSSTKLPNPDVATVSIVFKNLFAEDAERIEVSTPSKELHQEIETPDNKIYMVSAAADTNPELIRARNRKSIEMIIIIVSLFIICSVAPLVLKLYRFFADPFPQYPLVELVLFIISYSNAWMNAIVILVFRKDIRSGLKGYREETTTEVALANHDVLLRTD